MKVIILPILVFVPLVWASAQPPSPRWARSMGGRALEEARSIAVDASGNVYTTGIFDGAADFDPGPGVYTLTSSMGAFDIFISKLDGTGNFQWAKQIGGTAFDFGNSLALDASGNTYITGSFYGTVDFDPGPAINNLTASTSDIYILKLDALGNFIWVKNIGGETGDEGTSISVDPSGNVFCAGKFSGTPDFDPGTETFNLSSSMGQVFILKLTADGNFVWALNIVARESSSIAVDNEGNIYSYSDGTMISKHSASGNLLWTKNIPGNYSDSRIAVDALGNVYGSGGFYQTVDFDPGEGTSSLTSAGISDIFIWKLSPSGNFVWAKRMGGSSSDLGKAIALDGTGNVFTTGYFYDTGDFDPGPGTYTLTASFNDANIFILKLDSAGNFVWANNLKGYATGNAIAVNLSANLYVAGFFAGAIDFDTGPGSLLLRSNGYYDVFVCKLSDIITEISDEIDINNVTIYPNPTDGVINLSFLKRTPKFYIEIYNTLGTLVLKETVSDDHKTVALLNAKGLYFVKVISNNKIIAFKTIHKN